MSSRCRRRGAQGAVWLLGALVLIALVIGISVIT
jgi:hypothetical protein